MRISRTIREQDEHSRAGDDIDQGGQCGFRHFVDPVKVFDHHHHGLTVTRAKDQGAERIDEAGAARRRIERVGTLGLRVKEKLEVRHETALSCLPALASSVDLRLDRRGGVAFFDPVLRADEVDQRKIRHAGAIRDAMSLDPPHPCVERTPKLKQKARFADAGFPGDEHHLAATGGCLVVERMQHAKLLRAADVSRQPALERSVEARPVREFAHDFVRADGLRLALDLQVAEIA